MDRLKEGRRFQLCAQGALARQQCRFTGDRGRDEDVDVIGLSVLSGSHLELVPAVLKALRDEEVTSPVVVGGIIPDEDRQVLLDAGVSRVYTPKDYALVGIMNDLVDLAESTRPK